MFMLELFFFFLQIFFLCLTKDPNGGVNFNFLPLSDSVKKFNSNDKKKRLRNITMKMIFFITCKVISYN